MKHTATYSPEDNKLRLYPACRLDSEDYARVKAAGFKWAPKQQLFVAPSWSIDREDLLLEMCGEIEDEDKSLVERAEEKADRLETLSDKRATEAHRAHAAVDAICEHIPLGQPILIGHHSEKRARKDAERIQNGMRKAVDCWKQAEYWKYRAAGALRAAKYKELPAVRARRIKKIEGEKRATERGIADCMKCLAVWESPDLNHDKAMHLCNYADHISQCFPLADFPRDPPASQYEGMMSLWSAMDGKVITWEQARDIATASHHRVLPRLQRWLEHYENRLAYERAMLAEGGGLKADTMEFAVGGKVLGRYAEWLVILRINRKDGVVQSVSTTPPKYWGGRTYVCPVEEIREYKPPTFDDSEKVKAAVKLPPICNYPGEGFHGITQAQWDDVHKDHKGTRKQDDAKYGPHRVRSIANFKARQFGATIKDQWGYTPVWITDAKRKDPPAAPQSSEDAAPTLADIPREVDLPTLEREAARRAEFRKECDEGEKFEKLADTLKAGVKVVVAPCLFPTPADVARQVVELAEIEPGMTVLEPSAGTGSLVRAVIEAVDTEIVGYESNLDLCVQLSHTFPGYKLQARCRDFLTVDPEEVGGQFPRIVMNPPFDHGSDLKHIAHALLFLKPGGRLVAICANGPRQQEKLRPLTSTWIELPDDTFKDQGTSVRTAIAVIDVE